MYGTVGEPWDNHTLELADPGYAGRALCEQNVQAASGSPFIRRRACSRSWALRHHRLPLYHGALDFCLRATGADHKIVWTPRRARSRYGGVSMQARQRKPGGRLTDQIAVTTR